MAGAMKIYELTASMAGTDKTGGTVRFKVADNQTVDTNDPVTIPSDASTNRSYSKQLRMYCATAPDTQIDNLQVYTDGGGFGTGITVNASNVGVTFSANATSAIANGVDFFTYTSGSALNLDAVDSTVITATGFGGDILKLQMEVASSASSGTLTAESVTFSYDEI